MTSIKALLYCTEAKPSLYKNYLSGKGEFVLAAKRNVLPRAKVLNGTVCFSCDIGKVEKIRHDYSPLGDDLFFTKSVSIPVDFERQTCLNTEQLNSYKPRYALYIENVKAIAPMPITALARRDPTGLNIAEGIASGMFRAPQNMGYAWLYEDGKWVRYLLLSIRPENICNIANGLKDIETRRQVVNEIKEMEK